MKKCVPIMCCMFDFGYKANDIAEVCGKSAATVRDSLRASGRVYRRYRNAKNCCPAVAVCMRLCGMTILEISTELGFKHENSAWRMLVPFGLTNKTDNNGKYDEAIKGLYEKGCRNSSEMARIIGCSQSHASKRCKDLGLQMQTKSEFNNRVHDAAVERYGSEDALRKARNKKHGFNNKIQRWKHLCSENNVVFDSSISLEKLIGRDGLVCRKCGTVCDKEDRSWGSHGAKYPSIDHIKPISLGGSHTWDNVQILCCKCNFVKGNRVSEVAS